LSQLEELNRDFVRDQGKPEKAVEGHWQIKYSNNVTRTYTITADGSVAFLEERRESRNDNRGGVLYLTFPSDGKTERLSLLPDGRLLVEHFNPPDPLGHLGCSWLGIGNRQ
jgi:hypothetical protein